MTIEISPSKPRPVAHAVTSPTESLKAAVPTPAHVDHPHGLNQSAASLKSLLDELASPSSVRRAAAAEALGRTANIAAAPPLIVALRDADADVAREAAASLGSFGSVAVEPLIAVLHNRDGYYHSVVRAAASHSLARLRDPAPLRRWSMPSTIPAPRPAPKRSAPWHPWPIPGASPLFCKSSATSRVTSSMSRAVPPSWAWRRLAASKPPASFASLPAINGRTRSSAPPPSQPLLKATAQPSKPDRGCADLVASYVRI